MYKQDSPASSGDVDFDGERKLLLHVLRIARRHFQLAINTIDSVGTALKGRLIAPDTALEWLADEDLIEFVDLEPPAPEQQEAA
jgi:hypothetical protein